MLRIPIAVFMLAFASRLAAQSPSGLQPGASPKPITAAEVIARYVAAIGGEQAFVAHERQHVVMEIDLPGGLTSRVESFALHPDRILVRSTMPYIGTTDAVYNRGIAWLNSDLGGLALAPAKQLDQLRQQSNLRSRLHRNMRSMTLTGQRRIEGKLAHAVHVVDVGGQEATEYFDPETGLLVAAGTATQNPAQDTSVVSVFSDYRNFDGILMPTKVTLRFPTAQTMVTRITHLDHAPVDTLIFVLPPTVHALLKQKSP